MTRYLFVVAHADDEILGAGATISRLAKDKENEIGVLVMSTQSHTRHDDLKKKLYKTHKLLGIKITYGGNLETEKIGDEPHQNTIKVIEDCIIDFQPDVVITHHWGDLHTDHKIVSSICQEAVRLPQRQTNANVKPIKKFAFMEIVSSSDWNFIHKFQPNCFSEVFEEDIANKIEALKIYDKVIRKMPHTRSEENIRSLCVNRGSQAGFNYAEAFEVVFEQGV